MALKYHPDKNPNDPQAEAIVSTVEEVVQLMLCFSTIAQFSINIHVLLYMFMLWGGGHLILTIMIIYSSQIEFLTFCDFNICSEDSTSLYISQVSFCVLNFHSESFEKEKNEN